MVEMGSFHLSTYILFCLMLTITKSCLFQDDTAFEKQSALFALAISDIVLINM